MRDPVYDYPLPRRLGFTLTYGLAVAGTLALGILPGPVLDVMQALNELLP